MGFGTPGETRTHYLTLRRRTLYPGELRGRANTLYRKKPGMSMKIRHIFSPLPHIMGKSELKGAPIMEEKEEVQDIDDFIFADEEYSPSEK